MLLTAALFLPAALLADPPVRAPEGPTARVDDGLPPRDIVPIVLLRRSAKKAPDGSGADVLVPADFSKDDIARRVRDLMSRPSSFSQVVLRLDRYVKRYLLADPGLPAEQRAALEQPAYLFLSDRQGGFPLEHFWLEGSDGGLKEMRNVPFVDMVVDEHDLEPGAIDGLEQIYAHELGHLMMAALAGPAPRKASSAMHFMTVRTDPWYAFTEGFGEHFQPVALDHYGDQVPAARRNPPASDLERFWQPRFAREQVEGCWICPANLRFVWWHGGGEQRMRDAPLRENLFVHQVTLPEPLQGDGRPASEVRMYRDVIAPSPGGPLKNASQMLSSEAVIASLFYRLVSDGRLRDSHREPSFYRPFLGTEQPASLAPGENVYLKLFDVLHHGFEWNDAPAISFVSAWASRFPEDAPALYDVFLGVTGGITVERGAAGAPGDAGYLAGLRDRVLAGTARLDGNLGRPLWLVSPGMTFGMGLYRYVPLPQNFTLDLNAADVADLRAVPGVSSALATAIVRERDARGAFASVADLSAIPGMTPELVGKFEAGFNRMEDRFRRAAERTEKRSSNPTWMMNYLVFMVKGAYYAAAAWQVARALVVAGIGYLLVVWLAKRTAGQRPVPPAGKRRRLRRGLGALTRAAAVAALPLAVSATLYSFGFFPTPVKMAGAGLALGFAAWWITVARRTGEAQQRTLALSRAAALVVASVIIGAMY